MTRGAAALAAGLLSAGGVAAEPHPVSPESPALVLAREAGLPAGSVREVFRIGSGDGRLSLFASLPVRRRLCLSSEHPRGARRFASAFRCVAAAPGDRPPLIVYGVHAETFEPALRVTLVALVRPDVTRLVVTTYGGRRVQLPLRAAGSVSGQVGGYAALRRLDRLPPRRNDFARMLTAYRGTRRVATVNVGSARCCAGPEAVLTEAEKQRTIALATSHPEVRQVVGERVVRIVPDAAGELVGVWQTYVTKRKLGALVELAWDEPLAFDRERRTIAYDYTEVSSPPYREGNIRLRTNALTRLTVIVDLRRNKVVALEPGPRSG